MKKSILYCTVLLCSTLFLLRCATNPVTADGSGSDVGNGNVIGSIFNTDYSPGKNTLVKLIPSDYNPVTDGDLPDSLIDTTNSIGMYYFRISEPGSFNVEAVHNTQRTRVLIKGISVTGPNDTSVTLGILKNPGAIRIFLQDTIDTNNSYIFIKGTTQSKKITSIFEYEAGGYEVTFDSLTEEYNSVVFYDIPDDPNAPTLLLDTLDILSGEMIERDAFLFWANYTRENSLLPGNTVNDIFIENNNIIWFAVNGGVARLSNIVSIHSGYVAGNWTVYTPDVMGIKSDNVLKIEYVVIGKMWFASSGGLTALFGSSWLPYTTDNSDLPTNFILDVKKDSDQNAWLGTHGAGLVMFDGTVSTIYDTSNVPVNFNNIVTSVLVDIGDTIWCTTPSGVLKHKDTYWKFMHSKNSFLLSDDNYCMAIDRERHKWFGREGGVTRYDEADSMWTHYTSFHSAVFTDSVLTIVEDNNGTVWFGTSVGLTKYDGNEWHDYTGDRYPVLKNKGVRAIAFDNFGNTWIGTTRNGVIAFGRTIK